MTQAGAVPDLTAAADVLGRAADRLEKLAADATPGPWCFYGDDLWTGTPEALAAYDADPENVEWPYDDLDPLSGHLFRGDPGRPADAEFIATVDPHAVAALVPALKRAAGMLSGPASARARNWGRGSGTWSSSPAGCCARSTGELGRLAAVRRLLRRVPGHWLGRAWRGPRVRGGDRWLSRR